MKTTSKTNRPKSSKPAAAADKPERGNMSYEEEIVPLIMAAREAHSYQDPGIAFDPWRKEQVQLAVGRAGLTACDHGHFCDLMGHFKAAAGKDDEALHWFLKGAKNSQRQIAWSIAKILSDHIALAHSTEEALKASTPPRKLKTLLAAREAILDHPEGPLNFGDLLTIVRGKTRRPDLTLGADFEASLVDRIPDKLHLTQILFTITNRRNEREGRGHTSDRNKSQKSEQAKQRRSPHEMAPRNGPDCL